MKDNFFTLESPSEGYYMDRGSKFLAYAIPVQSEVEAHIEFQKIRKEHPKATHYCTALRLFPDASLERSSDDGEPSGSAGRPILGQLIKHNLTNILMVVVRYFGGTQLGIPGLMEAYKSSTANAIAAGIIVERNVYRKVKLKLSYETFPVFHNYCLQNKIPVFERYFSDRAVMVIGVNKSTLQNDVKLILHDFSRMDFAQLEDYLTHLGMEVEFLPGDQIL